MISYDFMKSLAWMTLILTPQIPSHGLTVFFPPCGHATRGCCRSIIMNPRNVVLISQISYHEYVRVFTHQITCHMYKNMYIYIYIHHVYIYDIYIYTYTDMNIFHMNGCFIQASSLILCSFSVHSTLLVQTSSRNIAMSEVFQLNPPQGGALPVM